MESLHFDKIQNTAVSYLRRGNGTHSYRKVVKMLCKGGAGGGKW